MSRRGIGRTVASEEGRGKLKENSQEFFFREPESRRSPTTTGLRQLGPWVVESDQKGFSRGIHTWSTYLGLCYLVVLCN